MNHKMNLEELIYFFTVPINHEPNLLYWMSIALVHQRKWITIYDINKIDNRNQVRRYFPLTRCSLT